ncbi:hypothetical protein EIN_497020 [Entamoeba invadens IP1]|uniref:Leucine rich repeat containing protein BspA family protein n=1 Tax=Entamoeba invadens IP1 TaxID=370355 RepID=A0A0A1TZT6_ENTIV|nr:hypothetical protein EIN_497020 [Entamoeba invadens IP1]ELP87137.1 hypothetical protein EIN_497020 [Entamoeba invadens IP1]|eukprot:XP_004253908.1 hypothetical protein EIN_497020 [Entamoeba invadens IP1]
MVHHLDGYSLLIVSTYFKTPSDYLNVIQVCKKYSETLDKLHYNPIDFPSLFKKLETLHVYTERSMSLIQANDLKHPDDVDTQRRVIHLPVHSTSLPSPFLTTYLTVEFTQSDFKTLGNAIPEGTHRISPFAFQTSTHTSLYIPSTVSSIDPRTFEGCSSITSLYTKNNQFDHKVCYTLSKLFLNGNTQCKVVEFLASDRRALNYTIPESDNVLFIGNGCFADAELTKIEIPSQIVSLGDFAFVNCSYLTEIKVPKSVSYIGKSCFKSCGRLESFTGRGVVCVGYHAFYQCSSLRSVEFARDFSVIGQRCFAGCFMLSKIDLKSVSKIPRGCFENCFGLKEVVSSEFLLRIGVSSFRKCSNLRNFRVPKSVIKIGDSAFEECGVVFCEVPETCETIGKACFQRCEDLIAVTLGNKIQRISNEAFSHCTSLSYVKLPEQVESVGKNAFYGCQKLINLVIPPTKFTCEENCFYQCPVQKSKFAFHVTKSSVGIKQNKKACRVKMFLKSVF